MPENSLKEKTAKGLLWGGINNGAMQVLNLAFGIITARILNDSDYGMVGMLSIFSLIAALYKKAGSPQRWSTKGNQSPGLQCGVLVL